jgi:hypothetical protein
LALLFALAGCSGGGDERLTGDEYIRQADAECERSQRLASELDELPSERDEDFAELSKRLHEIARDELSDLRELEPPEELESEVDEWLGLREERLRLSESLTDALLEGDDERELERVFRALAENDKRSNEIGREIGFRACTHPPDEDAYHTRPGRR